MKGGGGGGGGCGGGGGGCGGGGRGEQSLNLIRLRAAKSSPIGETGK